MKIKKNYNNMILNYLKSNEYATGKQLALLCQVSERSIHNYVSEINSNEKIILSSSKGYYLNREVPLEFDENPITQAERIFFIVQKLLRNGNSVNSLSLTEELFISEATLSKDLQILKKELNQYDLNLKRKTGYLYLIGDEKDKRDFIREMIVRNQGGDSFQALNYDFIDGDNNISATIREIVLEGLKQANLFINDYSLSNIVLHLSITVNRLLNNNTLMSTTFNDFKNFPDELKAADYICTKLAQIYGISFPENEVEQIAFLLITKTSNIDFYSLQQKDIATIIGTSYYRMAEDIIEKVYENFYLDISDEEFLLKFSLHLKNAMFRAGNNYSERNVIFENIKFTYPLVYDVAVFCAMEFKKMTGLNLSEDEISFLAIHIGSVIEQKNKLSRKVKCILIYPKYYDYHRNVLVKLNNHFGEDMEIVSTISMADNIPNIEYDLIISSVKLDLPDKEVVLISQFPTDSDYERIRNRINKIKEEKKGTSSSGMATFFSRDLFEIDRCFADEYAAIDYITDKVIALGLAPQAFKEAVKERERSASTSFDNLTAIPHTIEVSANKTFGYVIINKKPMKWGRYDINIIILIGISRFSSIDFTELYPKLLDVFDDPDKVQQIINCTSYDEFIRCL